MNPNKLLFLHLLARTFYIEFQTLHLKNRIASHYMDELKMIVSEFPDPTKCPQCPYTAKGNKMEAGMLKHVALGHSMLDALLRDEKLLAEKKKNYTPIKPKKQIANCPICDMETASRYCLAFTLKVSR